MQHTLPLDPQSPQPLPRVEYDFPRDPAGWNGLVLVGEAPGKEEARLGHPFVGRSGKLLDEMLENAAINRARCLVANVFRSQPPDNKVDHFFISRRAAAQQGIGIAEKYGQFGSAWCLADFASDIDHLSLTLEKIKKSGPKMIVLALGRTPFWALTGEKSGLLNNVGKKFDCRLSAGVPVIPTFHPSFILRGNWGKKPEWLEHFRAAVHYVA